jgi:competence protein ComEC
LVWLAETLLQSQNSLVSKLAAQDAFLTTGIRWDAGHLLLCYLLLGGLALAVSKPTNRTIRQTRRNPRAIPMAILAAIALCLYDLQQEIKLNQTREIWIPHRTTASGLWIRNGSILEPFAESNHDWGIATVNFANTLGLQIQETKQLQPAYLFGGKRLLRISGKEKELQAALAGLTSFTRAKETPLILLLSHSPKKIDSTLLATLDPEIVIADGSNYYSALDRWEVLCEKLKIPFHATARKGAFRIDLNALASK